MSYLNTLNNSLIPTEVTEVFRDDSKLKEGVGQESDNEH